ncbi:ABC transporter ATP-binding protein [Aliarcobacter trophiarum LMG 25534]|uniref:ABC transporter ATP-binding protein n=1 Tax=Aliarcobacter trophiarum LMG 25534 TaxID=1032241 RepID=A0AAD0VMW0_9BACT|nr:ABC transporter ATP-binding protein [Aliarcobacter trophiarum]AXK49320.1 ABC transporter, ATP-binding protein, FtsE/LolD family [Aliarcobacter trophiarum LMG 25534]RXI27731.1 ABC transporter ATP-binding protein [Aliarcobacter trophiarum]RXJ90113.1 ABC transporter ATP-binding protein [Aliarcobacter trophiarum LMG 25534]
MSEERNNRPLLAPLLLEAKNLSHSFDYELFKNININLHKKESVAIIGTSGSGKSTLLNILSSLLKPTTGDVVFQSKDLYSLKQNELLRIRRDDFGIIFQAHYLFRGFSAIENLNIATLLSHEEVDYNLLKELNITHVLNQGVGELSGGQQQRLSIARILMKKPKIIFADEPTGNLDKETASIVMSTLFKYIKENDAALILVTHEEDLAFRCDRVFKLEELNLKEIKK